MMMGLALPAIRLVEASTDFYAVSRGEHENAGGQVCMYTFEPASKEIPKFKAVVRALREFMTPYNSQWYWCLFTPEGLYQCYSDGRNFDVDGEPPSGGAHMVWTDAELISEGVNPVFEEV